MTKYEWLLIFHLLGVFILLAAEGLTVGAAIAMGRTSRVESIQMLAKLQTGMATWMFRVGTLMLVVFGAWLVKTAGFQFSDGWVTAAFVLVIVATAVGEGPLNRHSIAVQRRATALLADGTAESEQLQKFASEPKIALLGNVEIVILIALLVIMVGKPGA